MDWLSADSGTPLIIAHRGASGGAPENTVAAFGLAVEEGADGVELDVRLSADANVVVVHDATVDRTTDGRGAVSDLTAEQLRSLDAGAGQPVPTLDDVFQTFGPALLYNVEVKGAGLRDRGLEAAVADRIAAYHLENQVVVSSFNPFALRRARRFLSRSTLVGRLWYRGSRWLTHVCAQVEADHPHHELVDLAYVTWARQHGYRVHVWTVDDPSEAQRLASLGVDAIITNYPRQIREALS